MIGFGHAAIDKFSLDGKYIATMIRYYVSYPQCYFWLSCIDSTGYLPVFWICKKRLISHTSS